MASVEEWDRLIGFWITNVPYILTNGEKREEWTTLRREYVILDMDTYNAVNVALYGSEWRVKDKVRSRGFLIQKKKECLRIRPFFTYVLAGYGADTAHYIEDAYGDKHRYVYIEGHKFPYVPTEAFYTYHGIHPKIISGIRRTYQTVVIPEPPWRTRELKNDPRALYMFFWYATHIVGKYPGVCTPIASLPKGRIQYSHVLHSMYQRIDVRTKDWSDIGVEEGEYLELTRRCLRIDSIRFVFMALNIYLLYESHGSHANMMIFDKNTKRVYRFDPTGTVGTDYEGFERMAVKLISTVDPDGRWEYVDSTSWCPRYAFQSLEETRKGRGFCAFWTLWFMEVMLKNPDVDVADIHRMAQSAIMTYDPSFSSFIRRYTQSLQDFGDAMRQKLRLTYKTPPRSEEKGTHTIVPEEEAVRLREYVEEAKAQALGVASRRTTSAADVPVIDIWP